jgi:hypothetical protein
MKSKEYDNMIERAASHIEKIELVRNLRSDLKTIKSESLKLLKENAKLRISNKNADAEIRRLRAVVDEMSKYEELAVLIKRIAKEE